MKVSHLFIYPVKSLRGNSIQKSVVKKRGFQFDRRWMLVDEKGVFLSQRSHPKMALIKTAISDHTLQITDSKQRNNQISIALDGTEATMPILTEVWDSKCEALAYPETINDWFSQYLEIPCKLVYMPNTTERKLKDKYNLPGKMVSFADGAPYLITGQASLDDLNSKLETPVGIDRFRPNIVVSGGQPFEEDRWENFKIGNVRFKGYKLCIRCNIPTVDPTTGLAGKEPLKTLATYRRWDNQIYFGQNAVWLDQEWREKENPVLNVGDALTLE